jgi:hypothetical protein
MCSRPVRVLFELMDLTRQETFMTETIFMEMNLHERLLRNAALL